MNKPVVSATIATIIIIVLTLVMLKYTLYAAEWNYYRGFYSACRSTLSLDANACNEITQFVKSEYDGFNSISTGYEMPK